MKDKDVDALIEKLRELRGRDFLGMTAHERAYALFIERGPMSSREFAAAMWPTRAKHENGTLLYTEAGKFLTEMHRRGLLRRDGQRQYYAWEEP